MYRLERFVDSIRRVFAVILVSVYSCIVLSYYCITSYPILSCPVLSYSIVSHRCHAVRDRAGVGWAALWAAEGLKQKRAVTVIIKEQIITNQSHTYTEKHLSLAPSLPLEAIRAHLLALPATAACT